MGGGTRNSANTVFGGRLRWLAALAFTTVTGSAFAIDRGDSQILYFESLQLATQLHAGPGQQKSSGTRELQFEAYGRHFVVTLEPNDKLSPLLQDKSGAAASDLALYRGRINGDANSWARLSMADGKLQGMLWDGAELYVIEPVAELQASLPANTPVDPNATAIFRLDDVVMTPGAASCGADTSTEASKGNDAYNSMLAELKGSPMLMQAAGATRRIEISALGDNLLMNRFGNEAAARAEILRRLNNVDGIFSSSQLNIEISVPSIEIGDSLSNTTSASSLLSELGALRKRSPNLYSRGLTHLFTGRNLDGTTVGIAYVGSVCDRQYGAGLTESSNTSWVESLIAAHEIGHSFGAPHDGEASEACAGAPAGFLMAPAINGNDKFSQCSLNIMQARAAKASCITSLPGADIEVDAYLGAVHRPLDNAFQWNVAVRNAGGMTSYGARAEIIVPSELEIEEALVTGGTCTSGAGRIMCELGHIAGGNSASIDLSLRSKVAAAHSISVDVSAANENNIDNNRGSGTISTQPEVDLAVSLQAPTTIAAGASFNATLSASNLSAGNADAVTVTIALPAGVTASSATFNGGNCVVGIGSITCSLPSLASGANLSGSATLTANAISTAELQATISSGQIDPIATNNTAATTVSVTGTAMAAQSASAGSGGGGGGGSASVGLLALLLGALGLKNLLPRPTRSRRRG